MGSILIGLIPALGWGFQGIAMQKIGGTTANKQMGMVLTALVMSIFVALVDPIAWSPALIAAAAVNGIPWAIAQILQIKSFDYLGVSRAMPLTAGMQLILTSIIGAFYFGEWPQAWQMGVGFAGIALIIVGTVLTTLHRGRPGDHQQGRHPQGRHHHGNLLGSVRGLCHRC
jgi:glucose uptake protein